MYNIPIIIPYVDDEEMIEISTVLKSGWLAQGLKVKEFEEGICKYERVKYGIASTSCTTSLHMALSAMGADVNSDCIVPSLTFIATPNSVTYTGAAPVFVDVRTDTYNMCIESLEKVIQNNYFEYKGRLVNRKSRNILKVIIPVNLFGLCADLPKINKIAKKYDLSVLQDSACALGAKIGNKTEAEFNNTSCLSFHPRKSITTGEGGMVLTNNAELAEKVRMLRSHGASISETERHKNAGCLFPEFNELGYNYRMSDIQAAVGVAQIRKLDYINSIRNQRADYYTSTMKEMNIDFIKPPCVPEGYYTTYQSYVCMLDNKVLGIPDIEKASDFRNDLMKRLEKIGVATRVGTHATHMLGYYKKRFGHKNTDFIGSYMCDRLSITLPLYVQMTEDDQNTVLEEIVKAKEEIM